VAGLVIVILWSISWAVGAGDGHVFFSVGMITIIFGFFLSLLNEGYKAAHTPTAVLKAQEDFQLEDVVLCQGTICCVCLEEAKDGTAGSRLPCGHVFHSACIVGWLTQPKCCWCPVCRAAVPKAPDVCCDRFRNLEPDFDHP